ncbi:tetratricopeptide repeat protein [Myxococcus sp. K38C18041901]|uniref:serine/threonine-protein kinase n=1 Tax=Myxococcus guangdongensis TaxID=2906760 RepID=UPI0020A6FA3A|nr:tetratricopeptide repeat protein [Myxococcus guangdongensis]MCP3064188.1 tetratricopeptide repeat protein [Myxococcus guangdongensis]
MNERKTIPATPAGPERGAESCPSETTLADFLAGLLAESHRAHVLAHVERCADCRWALAAGDDVRTQLDDATAPTLAPLQFLTPGTRVSRYVVRARLGAGAMGVVYAAEDPELGRQVALKVLRPEGRQRAELQQRLQREAQALARLSHPNVVTLFDVGTHEDCLFFTMALVEGTTLAEWMKERRAWREVLRVFLEVGRGLAAAHAAGLVHRDIKPANILMGRDGRVCVTDFGIARLLDPHEALAVSPESPEALPHRLGRLTRTGFLLGTPAYLAPELLRGRPADARSDEFSFCVALHEALYGVRPFPGATLREMAQAMLKDQVRPPERDTQVPVWVRRAVLRGLRADPAERFASMEPLLAALTPPPRRVRTWVATTATVTGLLGALVALGVTQRREARCAQEAQKLEAAWGPARRERVHAAFLATGKDYAAPTWERVSTALDAYAHQWRTLRTEACLATGREDPGKDSWQTAACLDTRLWQLATTAEVLEKADARTVEKALVLTSALEGLTSCRDTPGLTHRPQPPDHLRPRVDAARHTLAQARAHLLAGRRTDSLAVTAALLEDTRALDFKPLTAEVLLAHGMNQESDQPQQAEESLYQALWAAEAGRDDETVARAWMALVRVVGEALSRPADAEKLVRHAQAAVERLGRERFPDLTSDLHLALSSLRLQQGKLEEAEQEARQGLEFSRERQGQDSLRAASLLHQFGKIRMLQRRDQEMLELHLQALEMRKRLLGPDNPSLAVSYDRVGSAYHGLGRNTEAIDTWRKALALQEAAPVPEPGVLSNLLLNLGMASRVAGRMDEAQPLLERARALLERIRGPDHFLVVEVIMEQAMMHGDQGRNDQTIALTTEALERLQRSLGPDTPRASRPLLIRGYAHLFSENHHEARRDLRDALTRMEKSQGAKGAGMLSVLLPLAEVAVALEAPKEALMYCERARRLTEQVQSQQTADGASALTCVGEAHLALGDTKQALPLLERAWRTLLQMGEQSDPLTAARTAFVLARARMQERPIPDRVGAHAMAEEARTRLESVGVRGRAGLQKVLAWQRSEGLR